MKFWRNIFIAVLAPLALTLVTGACGPSDSQLKGKTYVSEGWINNDTFQAKGLGAPKATEENTIKRKTQSKSAALLAAQARVVELLFGAKIEGAAGSLDGESTGVAIAKEFSGELKGGSIISETYDDEQNCEIVYQVHGKNLKKRVMDAKNR